MVLEEIPIEVERCDPEPLIQVRLSNGEDTGFYAEFSHGRGDASARLSIFDPEDARALARRLEEEADWLESFLEVADVGKEGGD